VKADQAAGASDDVELVTDRVVLRLAREHEAGALLDYFQRNREHLERWEPEAPPGFYTKAFWLERLETYRREREADRAHRFHLFERPSERVIGTVGISNVVRGCFHSAHFGFGLCASRQGEGVMREACEAVIAHAWDALHLHRLEANHQPQNTRSSALLRRLGFEPFGFARDYLLIGGEWVDHVATQRINPRWLPPPPKD
jgi:ribosomal-protein-alanine N-acetyltransferase